MRMYDLIYAKKLGQELSPEQIAFWVKGVTEGTIPDEQSASLLMAICLKGMTTQETLALTLGMRDSGKRIDLSSVPGVKVDKHSTGGVGDKTTLILGPIVAACGIPCSMFSGRGLGHTGGTVDKYSAIPGLKVELSEPEFVESLAKTHFANSAQTAELAPADRKLYALRDITATVESIPLITASIMSKKLAGGADALLLDVKSGTGAFMKTFEDSRALAESMVAVGKAHGMKIKAMITRMSEPLGWAIGNSLEVIESVEILRGEHAESDLAVMSKRFAAEMLVMGGAAQNLGEAEVKVAEVIGNGKAMDAFKQFVAQNGGDPLSIEDFSRLPQPGQVLEILAETEGYVHDIDSRALGIYAMELGAGRKTQKDILDLGVGLRLHVHVGDKVERGQKLLTVYAKAGRVPVLDPHWLDLKPEFAQPTPWLLDTLE